MNKTNSNNVANYIVAIYNTYWWGNPADSPIPIIEEEDATSQTEYGIQQLVLNLDLIAGATAAQAIVDWRLEYLKDPRTLVEYSGGFSNNDNIVSNLVNFNINNSYVNTLLVGLVTLSDVFMVCEREYQQNKVRLLLVKL